MKRRCGGANMGGNKWLSTVGDENGGRRGRYSGIMEMVCSRLWLAQPTVVGAANGDNERWHGEDGKSPEFQVFLNDLPGNDFNNIFSLLPDFYEKLTKEEDGTLGNCFITGVPGSFYSRIFPSRSLDFVHSSCSVHWLSQEIKPGGRMVITTISRSTEDPSGGECCDLLELLAESLTDMLAEELIEEADLNSFNLAVYYIIIPLRVKLGLWFKKRGPSILISL
ncbi:Salicylate carboxymethyltransferase [Vitis vinifera]|uniref:Salicylate carboxymethyltransferase n=1 Tax=Vitis vinifera TaxID=29760 RepID=A0A438CRZ2_VITVI|nr:Salicylate carboxymethyltransferase [Vitis vinifera]